MQRDRAKYLFHTIKNNFYPFRFEQDNRTIIANEAKMVVEVSYAAKTYLRDYSKTGKVVFQIDKNGKKILESSINEENKLPVSFALNYIFSVKVYIDISNFENLDFNDYIKVSYKNDTFSAYYHIRDINKYGIKKGLFIVLSHYDETIYRRSFF